MARSHTATLTLLAVWVPHFACVASVTSFASNDDVYCAEGVPRDAEAALAMMKAAPSGGLFNNSFGVVGVTCASRGNNYTAGVDSCIPDVTVHFKHPSDKVVFQASVSAALKKFAARYSLDSTTAELMRACTCKPGSQEQSAAAGQCKTLDDTIGCWVHQDPYNGHAVICDEGPFVYATRSLSVLKSSPQLAMHFRDQIAPVSCTAFGFPVRYDPDDHCYPRMHIYTRTPIATDAGVKEAEAVEANLTSGGFLQFASRYHIGDADILNNNLGCNCLASSSVGKQVAGQCWNQILPDRLPHSPVRDWWTGEEEIESSFVV